jgi:hypothetical protein
MMPHYAVMKSNFIDNIIIAESLEDAENLTLTTCINISDLDPMPGCGWKLKEDGSWLSEAELRELNNTEII